MAHRSLGWTWNLLVLLALLAGGCSSADPAIPDTLQVNPDPAPSLPSGVEIRGDHLFSLDRSTETLAVDLTGASGHRVEGVLADSWGRRQLRYVDPSGAVEPLAGRGWLLPPSGAVGPSGEVLVCFGALPGRNTELTEGAMPDPTQGLSVLCRHRTTEGWGPLVQGAQEADAAWLRSVEALPDGSFLLRYYRDAGWLVQPTAADHGNCTQRFDAGRFDAAVLVEPVEPG